ncbi:MAG: Gfo/Idh/MocA family oxidoreductase [Kiritimatiellia bacterium]
MKRRDFLISGGAMCAFNILNGTAAAAPSEKINMAFIGYGGRARQLLPIFLHNPLVQVRAVCDVIGDRRNAARQVVDKFYGNSDCKAYRDFREMLARPDIDAVYAATGDRWHAQIAIHAMKAGKDIYCEKPISLSMKESAAVVETAERYSRIYQGGVQRRGIDNFKVAVNSVKSGRLGKVHTLHAGMIRMGGSSANHYLKPEPVPAPEVVDWNMWLGPAPWREYNSKYFHRWHSEYDFHGDITEWGSHTVDLCQMAVDRLFEAPTRYVPDPEHHKLTAYFDDGLKIVMRDHGFKNSCAVRFEGSNGWVEADDSGQVYTSDPDLIERRKTKGEDWNKPLGHTGEFIECVRSRRTPAAPAEELHYPHLACHAATIAYHLNREVKYNPDQMEFVNDDEANCLRNRQCRAPWHL